MKERGVTHYREECNGSEDNKARGCVGPALLTTHKHTHTQTHANTHKHVKAQAQKHRDILFPHTHTHAHSHSARHCNIRCRDALQPPTTAVKANLSSPQRNGKSMLMYLNQWSCLTSWSAADSVCVVPGSRYLGCLTGNMNPSPHRKCSCMTSGQTAVNYYCWLDYKR